MILLVLTILLWSSGHFPTSYMITLRAAEDRTAPEDWQDAGTATVVEVLSF